MAYASASYTGNGTQTNFALPFLYLSTDDISVEVNGASVAFSWLNTNTVVVSPAPSAGASVLIRRISSRGEVLVNFYNGEVITESTLNKAYRHSLYVAEEAFDASEALENYQLLQNWVLAAEAAASSASGYSGSASGFATAASGSATAAAGSATAAAGSATAAAGSATAAAASATAAATSATASAASATDAATAAAGVGSIALLKTSNLSDLSNAATARSNLGLGSMATAASTDYVSVSSPATTEAMTIVGDGSASGSGPFAKLLELRSNTANTNGARWMFTHYKDGPRDDLTLFASDDAGSGGTSVVIFRRTGSSSAEFIIPTWTTFSVADLTASTLTLTGGLDQIKKDLNTDTSIDFGANEAGSGLWGWGRVDAVRSSAAQFYNRAPTALGNSSGAVSWDLNLNNRYNTTITGNITGGSLSAPTDPTTIRIKMTMGGSGSYTLALPSWCKWPASYDATAKTPSTAVGKVDLLVIDYDGTIGVTTLLKDIA